jgi:hypothetical protein
VAGGWSTLLRGRSDRREPFGTKRRILGLLNTAATATVYVDYSRIKGYPPTADIGWLRGYRGAVAVAADGTISPAAEGVEVYP